MENASKALIIAGAILISIVLVSVGVIVVNSLDPNKATKEFDQYTIDQFNNNFVSNSGNNVRGTSVRTLLGHVITSNSSNEESEQVKVNSKTASADISALRNAVINSHTYTVSLTYRTNGLVETITITDNAGGELAAKTK